MNTDCEYEVMRTNYVKYGGLTVQGKPGGKKKGSLTIWAGSLGLPLDYRLHYSTFIKCSIDALFAL